MASLTRFRYGRSASVSATGRVRGERRRTSRRRASGRFDIAAETLEERILPAVTLTIDYSLDSSGFFNVQARRDAIQAVANEIGARLNDDLGAVAARTMTVTNPSSYSGGSFTGTAARTFALAANELRIFVGGAAMSGGTVGVGGWRTNSGIRSFDANHEFEPYAGHIAFDNDGSTRWSYDDTPASGETNFRLVARHELLHVLGLGGATSWDVRIAGGAFTGANARAANGGANVPVSPDLGHFAQGVNSIMAPVIGSILHPTAIDWGALDDIGWTVLASEPPPPPPPPPAGQFADVFGRTADGTWYLSVNLGESGLADPTVFGRWDATAGWQDVASGDFNGDGLTDVVGRSSGGVWLVGLNNGAGFVGANFGIWNEAADWRDVRFGDFDGDGRDDVAGRTSSGEWWIGRSTGAAFSASKAGWWNPSAGWRDVRIGDFDGDGRDDIAGRTSTGGWYVSRGLGTVFATTGWASWSEAAGWRDVLAADFNGDGRDDLAARTSSGAWYVGLSVGTRFATDRWAGWNEAAGWRGVMTGDFAGDGKADIIARTDYGTWYVAHSVGSAFSTIQFGGTGWNEAAGWKDVLVGQFAGSTRPDVLGRASDGSWWLGENNGFGLMTFRRFGQWNEGLGWRDVGASRNLRGPAASPSVSTATVEATSPALAATVRTTAADRMSTNATPVPATEHPPLTTTGIERDAWPAGPDGDSPRAAVRNGVSDDLFDALESAFADAGLLDVLASA